MNRRLFPLAMAGGVVAALLTARGAAAQPPPVSGPPPGPAIELTLDDAVRRAIEHNPDLTIVRLGRDVESARVGQTLGAYAPVFSTVLGRSSTVTPPSTFLLGDAGVDVNDWFTSTGVRQRLRWGGGIWSVGWDTARTTTTNPLSSFDPSLQSGFQAAFAQPLFRDREIDPARHQYIVAKRNHQASESQFQESIVQTVASVKAAYWTLKAAIANVRVQQRSLELARELSRENRIRVDSGQLPPLDLVQADAEVAQRRENLIHATAVVEDAEDQLRRLIMNPADITFWSVRLDPVEDPSGRVPMPDVELAVDGAMQSRHDLTRAGYDLENATTDVEFFRNQKLPDVKLEASYRGSGLGGTEFLRAGGFPGVVTGTRNRSYGAALGQAFTPDYPTWSVGVTVNYPIGPSYERASLARAEIERRQAAERIASLRLDAAETVRRAARQIRSTAERMDAARAGLTLAEERLKSEQRRYEVGLSTTFLVTQAQRDLLQAEINVLQTSLDYEASLIGFEAVQQAPPLTAGRTPSLRGSSIVFLPTPSPNGIFRAGPGALGP